jgi:hypothetical protein
MLQNHVSICARLSRALTVVASTHMAWNEWSAVMAAGLQAEPRFDEI